MVNTILESKSNLGFVVVVNVVIIIYSFRMIRGIASSADLETTPSMYLVKYLSYGFLAVCWYPNHKIDAVGLRYSV